MSATDRLLFEKTGKSKYISHLDLMRTFQRAFMRAGISIKHTEGYNPHAFISVALPLSVGQESYCEMLDFGLMDDCPRKEVPQKLNAVLPEGIRVKKAYESDRPYKQIAYAECKIFMIYDVSPPDTEKLKGLFAGQSLIIAKRTKSGIKDTDILPCIKSIEFEVSGKNSLCRCTLTAMNPALNPENIMNAVSQKLPECAPDFYRITRLRVLDKNLIEFE